MNRSVDMTRQQERIYRSFLYLVLTAAVAALIVTVYLTYWNKIPSTIKIRAGVEQELDFRVPVSGKIYRVREEDSAPVSSVKGAEDKGRKAVESLSGSVESIPVNFAHTVKVRANEIDTYQMDLKLFGVIPYKNVDVEVIQDKMLIPSGIPIGIYVKTSGVLVVGIGEFENSEGKKISPAKYALQKGDYILKVTGDVMENKKHFV